MPRTDVRGRRISAALMMAMFRVIFEKSATYAAVLRPRRACLRLDLFYLPRKPDNLFAELPLSRLARRFLTADDDYASSRSGRFGFRWPRRVICRH